jgi:hypothetical protein
MDDCVPRWHCRWRRRKRANRLDQKKRCEGAIFSSERGDSTRHCPGAPEATESDSTSAGTRERKLRAEENARTRSDRRANHRGRAPPIADLARLQAPNRRRASLALPRTGPGSGRTIRRARDTRRGDHPEGDQGRVGGHHEGETPVGGPVTRASPTQEYPKTSVHSSSIGYHQSSRPRPAHSLTRRPSSIDHTLTGSLHPADHRLLRHVVRPVRVDRVGAREGQS